MPGGFPLGLDLCNAQNVGAGFGGYNFAGVYIAPNSSANTKTGFTQLIASTASDACWMVVDVGFISGAGLISDMAWDIAVGGAGSEQVIVSNLHVAGGAESYNGAHGVFSFPCSIPAGTRISARQQSNVASQPTNNSVFVTLFDGAYTQMEGCSGVDAIGFNAGTTLGTAITPGSSAFGSYAQLTASTSRDYIGVFIAIDGQAGSMYSTNATTAVVNLAVGASGFENVILPNLAFYPGQGNDMIGMSSSPFIPIGIPAGTRIAANAGFTPAAAYPTSTIGVTAYGVYQ